MANLTQINREQAGLEWDDVPSDAMFTVESKSRGTGKIPQSLLPTASSLVAGNTPVAASGVRQTRGTAQRTQASINSEWISVDDFGADPTGATDSTAAFNAAFDFLRAKYSSQTGFAQTYRLMGGKSYTIRLSGIYLCTGSINATAINRFRKWGIIGTPGTVIISRATGKAALDLYQSRFGIFRDFEVYGDENNIPSVGIFVSHGLASNVAGCGEHLFSGVGTNGMFSLAGLYDYASESTSFDRCEFRNGYNGTGFADAYAAIFTARNLFSMTSDYTTVLNPDPGVPQSFNGTWLSNTEFCRTTSILGGTTVGTGPGILLDDVKTFGGMAYVRQSGAGYPGVTLRSSGRLRHVTCAFVVEGASGGSEDWPNYLFQPDAGVTIRDIEITGHSIRGRSLIRLSADCLYVHGLKIVIPCIDNPLFETEYTGTTDTLMPAIRGFDLVDTSEWNLTYPSTSIINLDHLRWLDGTISSQSDSLLSTTLTVSRFSGTYFGYNGARLLQRQNSPTVTAGGAVLFNANEIRLTGAGGLPDDVSTFTKTNPLPYERVRTFCLHQMTFKHGVGNLATPGGVDYVIPQYGFVDWEYHIGSSIWRVVSGTPAAGAEIDTAVSLTLTAAHNLCRIVVTATGRTITIPSAATLGFFECEIVADGFAVTLDGPGANNVTLADGEVATVFTANSKVRIAKGVAAIVS
mgnify:CR=1 FL=1